MCAAKLLERDFADVCVQAGILLLLETSVKRALDRDWSDPKQKGEAVELLAKQVLSLERWLHMNLAEKVKQPPLDDLLCVLDNLVIQDLEPDPNGGPGVRIADQVAEDRRVSIEDGQAIQRVQTSRGDRHREFCYPLVGYAPKPSGSLVLPMSTKLIREASQVFNELRATSHSILTFTAL